MSFYRKKPVVIEARQLDKRMGGNNYEILDWIVSNHQLAATTADFGLTIKTLESGVDNWFECSHGDYIIKGVQGEFYACKPDIFHQTYEEVDDHE